MESYDIALNLVNSLVSSKKVKLLNHVLENIGLSDIHVKFCTNCDKIFYVETRKSNTCINCDIVFCQDCMFLKAQDCAFLNAQVCECCDRFYCMKCNEKIKMKKYCTDCILGYSCEKCGNDFVDESSAVICETCEFVFCRECMAKPRGKICINCVMESCMKKIEKK
jgi:hypothetical protein